jgi:hypothetical protein
MMSIYVYPSFFFLYSYFGLFWRRVVQDSVFYISQGHRGSKVFPRSSCH